VQKEAIKEIEKLYLSGKTTREIAGLIKKSKSSVGDVVKKLGIGRFKGPRPDRVPQGNKCDDFDDDFISYLDGLIISDGSIYRKGKSNYASYHQSCVKLEWLEAIAGKFAKVGIKTFIKEEKRKKGSWQLRTLTYDKLCLYREKWYKNNIKILPLKIDVINSIFLHNWIYGDGTLLSNNCLRLCTDNFTEKEVDRLIKKLNIVGVKFRKLFVGISKNGKLKFRLALCLGDGLHKFYDYIGPSELDCYAYKWLKEKVEKTDICKQCGNKFVVSVYNRCWCSKLCCTKANRLLRGKACSI
jgi:hypothetical protein